MATITTNISGLNISEKSEKGVTIIGKSTSNPLVPGNAAPLAAFNTAQTAMVGANADLLATRDLLRQQTAARDTAEAEWDAQCTQLAAFTQSATGGDLEAILSSGFGVRAQPAPRPPLAAPAGLTAKTNGSPGNTKLRWDRVQGAVSYLVEMSPDPITADSWVQVDTPTKASCEVGGAQPGKICWFQVAAVSSGNAGNGPWSVPAQRQVM